MASRKRRRSGRPPVEGVMGRSNVECGAAMGEMPGHAGSDHDPVRRFFALLPRPLRFLGVGGLGLITDLAIFTFALGHGLGPLPARAVSLAVATVVPGRPTRPLPLDRGGRRPGAGGIRYSAVAASAQAVSYVVFAILVVTLF